MPKAIRFLLMAIMGCCLSSCSVVYHIKVNGYTDPGASQQIASGGRFFVMENKEVQNPLLEAEIKGKITRLLESRGYPVTTFEKADYYLFFRYGLGEPRSVAVARPDYWGGIGWGCNWGCGWGWGGPSVCIAAPPYGGWGTDIVSLYDRVLQINVVEGPAYRTQKISRSVWVGEARSTGASSDLRTVLNYLLVAEFKEFGNNTGKAISIEIKEKDPAVYSLTH